MLSAFFLSGFGFAEYRDSCLWKKLHNRLKVPSPRR